MPGSQELLLSVLVKRLSSLRLVLALLLEKKGAEIEGLKKELEQKFQRNCFIDIQEVRRPEADAQLVAENIATQLERRIAFRRAMKKSINSALPFWRARNKISRPVGWS